MCFVILCICKQAKIRAGVQVKESKETMTAGKMAKKQIEKQNKKKTVPFLLKYLHCISTHNSQVTPFLPAYSW